MLGVLVSFANVLTNPSTFTSKSLVYISNNSSPSIDLCKLQGFWVTDFQPIIMFFHHNPSVSKQVLNPYDKSL